MTKIAIKNAHPHVTSMFAEDSPKHDYSGYKIGQLNHSKVKIDDTDVFRDSTLIHLQTPVSSRSYSTTAGLPWKVHM